ncbi:MAG: D-tyrosyl-tRNA(Tyr) deacylase [Eggerthellaceae bacterium]|nr:D-tyrosyl-tRNA(Tyr) deacylase [Eggerthellaceae bacterium]
MRALIQRVSQANVSILDSTPWAEEQPLRNIDKGFVVMLGVSEDDTPAQAERLWNKILKMRIFEDEDGKTNLSLADVRGQVMVVSQFTLYANCKKGNRPSFTKAGSSEYANELYRHFIELARKDLETVATGEFGACMSVSLVNEGPFTIWLDTDEL